MQAHNESFIYADYNGSAPLHPHVKSYLHKRLEENSINNPYANPNSIHILGQRLMRGLEKCRAQCAAVLGAKSHQVIFNSGASEGISHIFNSVCENFNPEKNIIIISSLEHSAVLNAAKYYQSKGYDLKCIPALPDGKIDTKVASAWINEFKGKIRLVSVMAANNETGVIQPLKEIVELCQQFQIPFFSDTTQFVGKIDFNFEQSGFDFAVCSGHKIGALTGSGLILAKNPRELKSFIHGGGQENNLRGGTQNYMGIETLAVALESFAQEKNSLAIVNEKRIQFEEELKKRFPNLVIIGEKSPRLASTTLVAFPGVHGQAVQIELESQNIFVTTSSACSDNEPVTSKVLKAMGIDDVVGRGVVRVSIGLTKKGEEYKHILNGLSSAYSKLAKISSY